MTEMTSSVPQIACDAEIPETIRGWQYLCQWDPSWKDEPYSVTGQPEQTIGITGCVPTLQSVVLRNLCGTPVAPPELAAWNVSNGMRTANNGTLRASWNLLVDQAHLHQEIITNQFDEVAAALAMGGVVVASLKAPDRTGLGTPSGHVVGITAVDERGGLRAIDVNNPLKSEKSWEAQEVLPFVNSALRHIWRPDGLSSAVRLRKARPDQRLRARLMNHG